ncbi:hypothetical protein [uncultured Chryseobacterium sp.]|uniref:hypothetical protein n=1 Tax=uncultured Chryseobacterium sp. TaxID=259322 RepID=UPI0025E860AF|nr:hypothetical protein [uncultured Chryseobacterium sp.]
MKRKTLTFLAVLALTAAEAKVCTKSCYNSSGGYGIGMGWNIPNGTACSGNPPRGKTVYFAYATTEGVFDSGVVDSWEGTSIGC